MIRARFYFDGQNRVRKFSFSGHSDYAEAGMDIVCAAVSAIGLTVIASLESLLELRPMYSLDEEEGLIECEMDVKSIHDRVKQAQALALMGAAWIGISQCCEAYPRDIRVEEIEDQEEAIR